MSEESTTATDADATSGESATPTTADTALVDAPSTDTAEPPKNAHWYQRSTGGQTYVDRYVYPALVPLISVAIIIFYVINVSRVFLSGKGTIAIVTAAAVTVAILAAAAALSSAPRMRTQSLTVFTGVALLAVMLAGYITVGHAQEKKEAAVVACKPSTTKVAVAALPTLKFDKPSFAAKAGCVEIDYGGAAGHTFAFDPPGPSGPELKSAAGQGGPTTFAWTLKAGSYTFYCTVPGHRAAGMVATLVVK